MKSQKIAEAYRQIQLAREVLARSGAAIGALPKAQRDKPVHPWTEQNQRRK